MSPRSVRFASWIFGIVLLGPAAGWAQFGGGGGQRPMGPGMGPGQGPSGTESKEPESQAEAAPEGPEQSPALQPLPAFPSQEEKKVQFLELHGYFRGRAFFFHKLNLGVRQSDLSSAPQPPFWVPYSETGATGIANTGPPSSCAQRNQSDCESQSITSTDMRLRLEPVLNVTDQVRVLATIDVFDNLIAGTTPNGYFLNGQAAPPNAPVQFFSTSQDPPEIGRNQVGAAIRVKRVWAEVKTPIGVLSFGRMPPNPLAGMLLSGDATAGGLSAFGKLPSHWGMGMYSNDGNCLDCDYGNNVDRVMFSTKLFNHFISVMWDWVATGPTTQLYTPNLSTGPFYNADPLNDITQWGLALGRRDAPAELKERVDRGDVVVNYGGFFTYRRQDWDLKTNPGVPTAAGQTAGVLGGTTPLALRDLLTPRHAWAFIPDVWLRLNWKKLQIELEAVIVGGKLTTSAPTTATGQISAADNKEMTILEFGGVIRADYRLLKDALHIGLEVGYASGDPAEDPQAKVNFRQNALIRPITQDTISNFQFDPDFHVDLILFRRILGTVYNATYFKPTAAYDILDNLRARVDVIYSIANNPVGYPGNAINIGLELDGSVMYHNEEEGFYAGIAYGVLFPFGALALPAEIYGTTFAHSPETAQTVQGRLAVKF